MTVILTTVTDITSTVGSGAAVFYVFTKCYDSMDISGKDDQTNKMTRRIVRDNKNGGLKRTCLMIKRKSKTGGIKYTCQVAKLESRSGVSRGPHLLICQKPQVNLSNLPLRCRCSS